MVRFRYSLSVPETIPPMISIRITPMATARTLMNVLAGRERIFAATMLSIMDY